MKYRHYSPKAKVFLYDAGATQPVLQSYKEQGFRSIGLICTRKWKKSASVANGVNGTANGAKSSSHESSGEPTGAALLESVIPFTRTELHGEGGGDAKTRTTLWRIELGDHATDVARDLFWALRELDRKGCDVICVEGISAEEGDVAAAVMNRLKKAAEIQLER